MKRGRKTDPVAEHVSRGTVRRDRHGALVDLNPAPRDIPIAPSWMTAAGKARWGELIEAIVTAQRATGIDSEIVAHFCELCAASSAAWRSGAAPPAAHLSEQRRIAELLGVAGVSSRIGAKMQDPENVFLKLMRKP